jgi:hypothetical protein
MLKKSSEECQESSTTPAINTLVLMKHQSDSGQPLKLKLKGFKNSSPVPVMFNGTSSPIFHKYFN